MLSLSKLKNMTLRDALAAIEIKRQEAFTLLESPCGKNQTEARRQLDRLSALQRQVEATHPACAVEAGACHE